MAVLTAIAVGIAIAGVGVSLVAASKQAKAAKKNARIQNQQNAKAVVNSKARINEQAKESRRKSDRERRQNFRNAQIAEGQAVNTAAAQGGLFSSGLSRTQQGIRNQLFSNAGTITTAEIIGENLFNLSGEAADIQSVANDASTGLQVASSKNKVISNFGDSLFALGSGPLLAA